MPTTTPLTDAIQALTTYANETTGASDTTLSEAVATLVAGYGQGGGSGNGYGGDGTWARPGDMPKLDDMDISGGDVVYITYWADEVYGFCDMNVKRTSGSFTFDIGHIENGSYVVERTTTYSSNQSNIRFYFGSSAGGYKVIRISGLISELVFNRNGWNAYDGVYRFSSFQGLREVYGELPHLTWYTSYGMGLLKAVRLGDANINLGSCFSGNTSLESVDAQNWDVSGSTSIQALFDGCNALRYVNVTEWDTSGITTLQRFMYGCGAMLDISKWDMSAVTNTSQAFQRTRFVEITIPASLTVLSANTFTDENQHLIYHFKGTTPPTMANTNAFGSYHTQMVIYVPYSADHSVLHAYQTANNWSTYASYIQEEPQS